MVGEMYCQCSLELFQFGEFLIHVFNKIFIDNEKTPQKFTKLDLNFEKVERKESGVLPYKVQFQVPIQVKPHDKKKLSISYPTYSFGDALNGKMDYIENTVNAITEKFVIEVKLVGGKQFDYYLDYPTKPKSDDGSKYDIEIRDISSQRMWTSEISLHNDHSAMPEFSGLLSADTLRWVVYHPKIGYKYRLYFTVRNKNESPPIVNKQPCH